MPRPTPPSPAFLSPLPLPAPHARFPPRPLCALRRALPRPARPRVSACASPSPLDLPSAAGADDVLHDSWRVYSLPGNPCVLCTGKGRVKCLFCFGDGVIRIGPEAARDTLSCPQCRGAGTADCIRCQGSGIRPATREDPVTGEIVRNPTNEELNRRKTPEELAAQMEEERRAEEEADREAAEEAAQAPDNVEEHDSPPGEDGFVASPAPVAEDNNVEQVL